MKKIAHYTNLTFLLLYGLLIALNGCSNPTGFDLNKPYAQYDRYIVSGYVYENGLAVCNKSVWMYIKDYKYSPWQTMFECKTNYQGYYRFTVDYEDWNYYYYNLTCGLKQVNSRIIFGKMERIDFEL